MTAQNRKAFLDIIFPLQHWRICLHCTATDNLPALFADIVPGPIDLQSGSGKGKFLEPKELQKWILVDLGGATEP